MMNSIVLAGGGVILMLIGNICPGLDPYIAVGLGLSCMGLAVITND